PSARARRITACDSRESSKSICKEIALQWSKTGKFDYLSGPNHPAHSIALEFFTGDCARGIVHRDYRDYAGLLPEASAGGLLPQFCPIRVRAGGRARRSTSSMDPASSR